MSPFFIFIDNTLTLIRDCIWGNGLIIILVFTGVLLSFLTGFIQFKHLRNAFKYTFEKEDSHKGLSPFSSLCTALSSTVGTGNIVGVSSAVCIGGPGSLFWMVVAGFLGMAIKYAEGFLAVKYKSHDENNNPIGGPFYYIEKGLGKKFHILAVLFSVFGTLAGILGIGTLVQSNSIITAVGSISKNNIQVKHLISLLLAIISGIIIFGGIKRISAVSTFIVPLMSAVYIGLSLLILIRFNHRIFDAILLISRSAFCPNSLVGAAGGISIKTVIQQGFGRGMFSNEAGLGSAPIAAASVDTDQPTKQGLVLMLSTFLDTVVICSITGLTVTVTGAYNVFNDGVKIAEQAWITGLPFTNFMSSFLLDTCLILFAFTTIIGWNFYSEKCLEFLVNKPSSKKYAIIVFRVFYITAVFMGCYLSSSSVWLLADIFNGLMALPNLIAVILLSQKVATQTKHYFDTQKYAK